MLSRRVASSCAQHATTESPHKNRTTASRRAVSTSMCRMAGLHRLAVLLQDLPDGGQVEADVAEEVRDVMRRRLQHPASGVHLVQLAHPAGVRVCCCNRRPPQAMDGDQAGVSGAEQAHVRVHQRPQHAPG